MHLSEQSKGLHGLRDLAVNFRLLWGIFIVLLCFVIVYEVGFDSMMYVHNSFHDVRHAAGFPCH